MQYFIWYHPTIQDTIISCILQMSKPRVKNWRPPTCQWQNLTYLCSPWNSPGQNPRVGSLSLLQQIFLTQESNWGLLHCRQILCQLSYQGSPVIDLASPFCCLPLWENSTKGERHGRTISSTEKNGYYSKSRVRDHRSQLELVPTGQSCHSLSTEISKDRNGLRLSE